MSDQSPHGYPEDDSHFSRRGSANYVPPAEATEGDGSTPEVPEALLSPPPEASKDS